MVPASLPAAMAPTRVSVSPNFAASSAETAAIDSEEIPLSIRPRATWSFIEFPFLYVLEGSFISERKPTAVGCTHRTVAANPTVKQIFFLSGSICVMQAEFMALDVGHFCAYRPCQS